jgi:hypothetical protein
MMDEILSSETPVLIRVKLHHIPDVGVLLVNSKAHKKVGDISSRSPERRFSSRTEG